MDRLFGTDGARGIAVTEFTCETALLIGRAVALMMCAQSEKPKVIIGLDTRVSGEVLQAALASGICSMGADAVLVGVGYDFRYLLPGVEAVVTVTAGSEGSG